MMKRTIWLIVLMFALCFTLQGCQRVQANTSDSADVKKMKSIESIIEKFYRVVDTQNKEEFASLTCNAGVRLIRTYLSGNEMRGEDIDQVIDKSNITDKLIFNLVDNEYELSLKTEFSTIDKSTDYEIITINRSINWDSLKIELLSVFGEIVEDCKKVELKKYIYLFDDGSFCSAYFAGDNLQFSRWIVFVKNGDDYSLKLIALVN